MHSRTDLEAEAETKVEKYIFEVPGRVFNFYPQSNQRDAGKGGGSVLGAIDSGRFRTAVDLGSATGTKTCASPH